MATAYLTVTQFKLLTLMPSGMVDELETIAVGWLDERLLKMSARIDSQLRKRYAVPFATPVPDVVQQWLADLVTPVAFLRMGINPSDPQWADVSGMADEAKAEIQQAANAVDGLFDLPLRSDTTTTGATQPATLAYSEASPYVGFDRQISAGRDEDFAGDGTYS